MRSEYQKMLHKLSELGKTAGTEICRSGVVDEVKEEGGERKFRCIMGYTPDGKPWKSPWMSSQEQRSSNQRSQDSVKKGQNMMIQGPSFRQATATPAAESPEHQPQPNHGPETNGRSQSIGKKLRLAYHGGQDDEQQGGSGGGGSGGGSQGGGGQQQGEKEHYLGEWIAKEEEKLGKYQPQSGQASTSKGGKASSGSQQAQQGQQGQQQEEMAMHRYMHGEKGMGNVYGKGKEAVRSSVEKKGAQHRAGEENWMVTEKDKANYVHAKKENYVHSMNKKNYVNAAWIIKDSPKNPLEPYDLKGGKSGGSGGGSGGSAMA